MNSEQSDAKVGRELLMGRAVVTDVLGYTYGEADKIHPMFMSAANDSLNIVFGAKQFAMVESVSRYFPESLPHTLVDWLVEGLAALCVCLVEGLPQVSMETQASRKTVLDKILEHEEEINRLQVHNAELRKDEETLILSLVPGINLLISALQFWKERITHDATRAIEVIDRDRKALMEALCELRDMMDPVKTPYADTKVLYLLSLIRAVDQFDPYALESFVLIQGKDYVGDALDAVYAMFKYLRRIVLHHILVNENMFSSHSSYQDHHVAILRLIKDVSLSQVVGHRVQAESIDPATAKRFRQLHLIMPLRRMTVLRTQAARKFLRERECGLQGYEYNGEFGLFPNQASKLENLISTNAAGIWFGVYSFRADVRGMVRNFLASRQAGSGPTAKIRIYLNGKESEHGASRVVRILRSRSMSEGSSSHGVSEVDYEDYRQLLWEESSVESEDRLACSLEDELSSLSGNEPPWWENSIPGSEEDATIKIHSLEGKTFDDLHHRLKMGAQGRKIDWTSQAPEWDPVEREVLSMDISIDEEFLAKGPLSSTLPGADEVAIIMDSVKLGERSLAMLVALDTLTVTADVCMVVLEGVAIWDAVEGAIEASRKIQQLKDQKQSFIDWHDSMMKTYRDSIAIVSKTLTTATMPMMSSKGSKKKRGVDHLDQNDIKAQEQGG